MLNVRRTKSGNHYNLNTNFIRENEFNHLFGDYENILEQLLLKKEKQENFEAETKKIKKLTEKILSYQSEEISYKNILSFSSFNDRKIWNWQDSSVYEIDSNEKYVYKESFLGSYENFLYLKHKYLILKKYLWEHIPKSYFVFWEWITKTANKRWFKNRKFVQSKIFTIQRKIKWKDFSKLSKEEKKDEKLLLELEKAHKKYILLKIFLSSKIKELWLSKKSMDLQLDLWFLSNKDNFSPEDVEFIESKLTTPNLMWDSKNISFIDFGSWEWDDTKQKIFEFMMSEKNYNSWLEILKNYGLNQNDNNS